MKNTICALILIASASQTFASSALARINTQCLSRTALLASAAAGHQKVSPKYMQRRHLTSVQGYSVACDSIMYGLGSSTGLISLTESPTLAISGGLLIGTAVGIGKMNFFMDLERKEQEIKKLEIKLLEKNKTVESKKND